MKDESVARIRTIQRKVGRLERKKENALSDFWSHFSRRPTCSLLKTGHYDDVSEDTILAPKLGEEAVIDGIRICAVSNPSCFIFLRKEYRRKLLTFSRSWTFLCVVPHLASIQIKPLNVKFLVADDDLTSGHVIIDLPVLRHIRVG